MTEQISVDGDLFHPESDEVEVSLFGRGVGESIVIHLGNRRWMIVDSFLDSDGIPAARQYLDRLGVGKNEVVSILVTHYHTDHYMGIDHLHKYYAGARLHVTSAMATRTIQSLLGGGGNLKPERLSLATNMAPVIARASKRVIENSYGAKISGLRYLHPGQIVFRDKGVSIEALSPTEGAVNASMRELAEAIASDGNAVTARLRDDNRCSVALYGRIGRARFLLCGDVLASPKEFGWSVIVGEPNNEILTAVDLVKVSHHGSITGHDDVMWSRLAGSTCHALVAPYWRSGIPDEDDIERLLRTTGQLHQAAPSETTDEAATGRVTLRRTPSETQWRVLPLEPPAWTHESRTQNASSPSLRRQLTSNDYSTEEVD